MAEDTIYLSETLRLPFDSEAIRSRNPERLLEYIRKLVVALQDSYVQIANAVNLYPEYLEQATQPTPAEGQLMVWKNTGATTGQATHKVVYNDGGTILTFNSEEVAS
jgi:hypothetical protein